VEPAGEDEGSGSWSLADVTDVSLAELVLNQNSVLVESIRRIVAEADNPPQGPFRFNAVI
jgi:FXSXX-COOH protein